MKKFTYLLFLAIGVTSCSVESMDSTENLLTADLKASVKSQSGKINLDIPTLTLISSSETSLTIQVTAGNSGAPHGIWIYGTDVESNFAGDEETWKDLICEWNYNTQGNDPSNAFGANETRNFVIENICDIILSCGNSYYFKVEARPGSSAHKSGVAVNANTFSTASCEPVCTYGKGHWRNHSSDNPGEQENMWPVAELMIGNINYSQEELNQIMDVPNNEGNNLVIFSQHLIAAKLNVANGAGTTEIGEAIAEADNLIGDLKVLVHSFTNDQKATANILKSVLEAYNNAGCE